MHIGFRGVSQLALVLAVVGCTALETPSAPPTEPIASLQLQRVSDEGSVVRPVDALMGATLSRVLRVRVVNAAGAGVAGAAVRFVHAAMDTVVVTDAHGGAALDHWIMPSGDTIMLSTIADASLAEDPSVSLRFAAHAWRDLAHYGGDGPVQFERLPIGREDIAVILPLGTFPGDEALPSSAARLLLHEGATPTVRAMAAGLITAIDESRSMVTIRVRDRVRVEVGGFVARSDLRVGEDVSAGEPLGIVLPSAGATARAGDISVRVFDASTRSDTTRSGTTRSGWVRPERYGARTAAVFFGRYLADSLRAHTYALIRRAAPDLDGRIDYDVAGQLVGTWFDPSVNQLAGSKTDDPSTRSAMNLPDDERDPSAEIAPFALTFAYDAERPGQIRIAGGTVAGARLGVCGVFAVAWEDVDPATVGMESGVVRYRLYPTTDSARAETVHRVLLVQVLDAEHLRAEVVEADGAGGFTERATILVR